MTVMPRALARAPALTRLTRSVVAVSSSPRRTAAVSGEASCSASSPAISRVSVVTPPRENWAKNRPSTSASGRYGAIARAVSGVSSGALTAYRALRPSRTSRTCDRDLLGDRDLGLRGGGAEVRREQRVRCVEQRRAGRRLVLEDVDAGAAEMAAGERLGDGRLVEDPAARHVQDDRAGLELGDRGLADEPAGLRGSAGRGP